MRDPTLATDIRSPILALPTPVRPTRRALPLRQYENSRLAGHSLRGSCAVCGTRGVRFQGFTANLRETGSCSHCGASNRQRQMALVLRRELRLRKNMAELILPTGCRLCIAPN